MSNVVDFTKQRRQKIAERNVLGPDGETWAATVSNETYDITTKGYAYADFGEFIEEHLAKEAGALSQVAENVAKNSEALSALPPGYYIRVSMEVRAVADDAIRIDECLLDPDNVGEAWKSDADRPT